MSEEKSPHIDIKIFGIGFHKTGTKSLASALNRLDYRVTGPNYVQEVTQRAGLFEQVAHLLSQFDAFQDNPWPILYRELDQSYPNSKFILTLRPKAQWLTSVLDHFGDKTTPMRQLIYGAGKPLGNEVRYLEVYEQHNQEVQAYFQSRPDDLLVMDLSQGDGWNKLCPFLGQPQPEFPFPHLNRAEGRQQA